MTGLIVSSLAFALMQTLVIPALPVLQHDLHTSTEWVTWVVTIYLLTGSVVTPIIGRLGDQYGMVKMMVVSLTSFLIGSLGCLVSWNVASLIVFRGIQGVGAAVFPLAYAIIRDEFPEEKWSVTMGTVSATLGVGGGLGIVTAGLVVDNLNWRWLFVVSAVIGAVALVLVWRFIPESPNRMSAKPDIFGALFLSGGLIALLVALTEGPDRGWSSSVVVGLFVASAVLLVAWGLVESKVRQPMVDLRMMARRAVLFTNLTAFISGFSLYATWVLLPQFFQLPGNLPPSLQHYASYGLDTSVLVAGLWILPCSIAIVITGPIGGMLGRRIGARIPLAIGMLLFAIGAAGIGMFHSTAVAVSMSFMICGCGIGFAFASMPRLIVGAVAPSETGVATGMNNVIRTIGGVVGAQIAAVLLAANVSPGTQIPTEHGFVLSFWLSAVSALVGVVTALLVTGGGRWRLVSKTDGTTTTSLGKTVASEPA